MALNRIDNTHNKNKTSEPTAQRVSGAPREFGVVCIIISVLPPKHIDGISPKVSRPMQAAKKSPHPPSTRLNNNPAPMDQTFGSSAPLNSGKIPDRPTLRAPRVHFSPRVAILRAENIRKWPFFHTFPSLESSCAGMNGAWALNATFLQIQASERTSVRARSE
jgi:hypothetical protein